MEGYVQRLSEGKIKRYVQYLDISDDPALIAEYRKWHSEAHHWKEVRDGIREVGILEMELQLAGGNGPFGYIAPSGGVGSICGKIPGVFGQCTQ